jgi:hypothetical protein
MYGSVAQIVQKSWSHLKILGARGVAWSKFYTVGPQVLGAVYKI